MFDKSESKRAPISLRDLGYLTAVLLLGISIGLLLFPSLQYPAIWQWVLILLSLILMAFTAPALHRKR